MMLAKYKALSLAFRYRFFLEDTEEEHQVVKFRHPSPEASSLVDRPY